MKVRVSIGNLIPIFIPVGIHPQIVSIISKNAWNKKREELLCPIGGAAGLTKEGVGYVKNNFGAEDIYIDDSGLLDARFIIDESKLKEVFHFFSNRQNGEYFEVDPVKEMIEELTTEEINGFPAVMSLDEANQIKPFFYKTIIQPFSDLPGTSPLSKDGIPNRRLFHLFKASLPYEVFIKLVSSPVIRFLSKQEVHSTLGGKCKGKTEEGIVIADNFII